MAVARQTARRRPSDWRCIGAALALHAGGGRPATGEEHVLADERLLRRLSGYQGRLVGVKTLSCDPRFRSCDRDQLLVIPSWLEWLPEDHLMWAVLGAVIRWAALIGSLTHRTADADPLGITHRCSSQDSPRRRARCIWVSSLPGGSSMPTRLSSGQIQVSTKVGTPKRPSRIVVPTSGRLATQRSDVDAGEFGTRPSRPVHG